jgi:hypothetical protein
LILQNLRLFCPSCQYSQQTFAAITAKEMTKPSSKWLTIEFATKGCEILFCALKTREKMGAIMTLSSTNGLEAQTKEKEETYANITRGVSPNRSDCLRCA